MAVERDKGQSHISRDPRDRLGIYKTYSEVPDRRRLYRFASEYDGRDLWSEYCEYRGIDSYRFNRTGRVWADFVTEHGDDESPHMALVTPETVERWFRWNLEEKGRSPHCTWIDYGAKFERMFKWLMESTDHPHTYNPFIMAYTDPENEGARIAWQTKMDRR